MSEDEDEYHSGIMEQLNQLEREDKLRRWAFSQEKRPLDMGVNANDEDEARDTSGSRRILWSKSYL